MRREAAGAGSPTARSSTTYSGACASWCTTRTIRRTRSIQKAFWTYTTAGGRAARDQRYALRDIPDTGLKAGDLVDKVADLQADGSTSAGCLDLRRRLRRGENLSKRRDARTDPGGLGLYPNFAWTWPNNMRILYNRASCDRHGQAVSGIEADRLVGREQARVDGHDLPDVPDRTTARTRRTAGERST